jgi:hypothetical protein
MISIPLTKKLFRMVYRNIYKLLRGRVDEQTLGWLKQLKSILSRKMILGKLIGPAKLVSEIFRRGGTIVQHYNNWLLL